MNPIRCFAAGRSGVLAALLAAQSALMLGACESIWPADEDVMTEAEANAFAGGLYDGSLFDLEDLLAPADPEVALPGVPIPVEAVIPCNGGGEAAFSGNATVSVDEARGVFSTEVSGTLTADGCTFTSDGLGFALDTESGLTQRIVVSFSFEALTFAFDMTSSGSFGWSQGIRVGSCSLDNTITAEVAATDSAPTATVAGSVCGLTVDRTINLGFSTS